MTAADVQTGKYNWLAPWIGIAIIVGGWSFAAGGQAQALSQLREEVQELKNVLPEIATIKATSTARDREMAQIAATISRVEEKLDRVIEGRSSPRR